MTQERESISLEVIYLDINYRAVMAVEPETLTDWSASRSLDTPRWPWPPPDSGGR